MAQKLLVSKSKLQNTYAEYSKLYTSLLTWQGRMEKENKDISFTNESNFWDVYQFNSNKYITNDLSSFRGHVNIMNCALDNALTKTKSLIGRCEGFADIMEGAEPLDSESYSVAQTVGDIAKFIDDYCPESSNYEGKISEKTQAILDLGTDEEEQMAGIEEELSQLITITVGVDPQISHIRDCKKKQDRVEKLFHSLKAYGIDVKLLNSYVKKMRMDYFPILPGLRKHGRTYEYDGEKTENTESLFEYLLYGEGLDFDQIELLKQETGLTAEQIYEMWKGMDDTSKEFVLSLLEGRVEDFQKIDPEDVSDDALFMLYMWQVNLLETDEEGNVKNPDYLGVIQYLFYNDLDLVKRMARIADERWDPSMPDQDKYNATLNLYNYVITKTNYKNCDDLRFWSLKYVNGVLIGDIDVGFKPTDIFHHAFADGETFVISSKRISAEEYNKMTEEQKNDLIVDAYKVLIRSIPELDSKYQREFVLDMGDVKVSFSFEIVAKEGAEGKDVIVTIPYHLLDAEKALDELGLTLSNGKATVDVTTSGMEYSVGGGTIEVGEDGVLAGVQVEYNSGNTTTVAKFKAGTDGKSIKAKYETDTSNNDAEVKTTLVVEVDPKTPAAQPSVMPTPANNYQIAPAPAPAGNPYAAPTYGSMPIIIEIIYRLFLGLA